MNASARPVVRSAARAAIAGFAAIGAVIAQPVSAGVVDGVKTVDDLTVYLGVVPAAIVQGHKAELATAVHGGLPRASIHNVHLVSAVFNKDSGLRIKPVQVRARFHGTNQNHWTVNLNPMMVNGKLTYGAFTNLGDEQDVMISIEVIRRGRARATRITTVQFEYDHD